MSYTNGLDKPSDYFVTKLYSGTGGTQSITGLDFAPNWVWIKKRELKNHQLYDSVRGATEALESDSTSAETTRTTELTSFNSDGFSLGSGAKTNESSGTYVSWNWKAGTSFTNDASATGIGSIDSAGSVNETAGFSICTHTGTGSLGTIKHGLSTKPSVILTKERSEARDWIMYHHKNTSAPATDYLLLNTTDATADSDNFMNDTEPTSSVFTVKGFSEVNKVSQTYVSYIFSERQGYSKFSSYIGNGSASNGTFVYTGFKPAFVIAKDTSAVNNWRLFDNKRPAFNQTDKLLFPSLSSAETVNVSGSGAIDILSNGFKCKSSANGLNASGSTYIYMCFAENPFVSSTGVCATAR